MKVLYDLVTVSGECPDKMSLSGAHGKVRGWEGFRVWRSASRETCLPSVRGSCAAMRGRPDAARNRQYVFSRDKSLRFFDGRIMPLFVMRF